MAIFFVKSHTVSCCTYNQLREKCLGKLEDEWHNSTKRPIFQGENRIRTGGIFTPTKSPKTKEKSPQFGWQTSAHKSNSTVPCLVLVQVKLWPPLRTLMGTLYLLVILTTSTTSSVFSGTTIQSGYKWVQRPLWISRLFS